MQRAEREAILRQGVRLPETPRERTQRAGLDADLEGSPVAGRPISLRLRNFRPAPDRYLTSLGGPLPYMVRLREIDRLTAELEERLHGDWRALAVECAGDDAEFARRWRACAERAGVDEINELIDRHNRWYPAESRLPMDPARRDHALVNGKDYRREPLGASWVLSRFPPRPPAL